MSAANTMLRGISMSSSLRSVVSCSSAANRRSVSTLPSRNYNDVKQQHAHRQTNYYHQHHHLFSTKTRKRRIRGGRTSLDISQYLSSQQFLSVANDLLDKVESSLAKLKDSNEGVEITRYPPSSGDRSDADGSQFRENQGRLSIKVPSIEGPYDGGTYLLTINADDKNIALQCLSGNFTYVYNTGTGEWVGQEDGHSMLGILTRDWIRQCHGVPDF